MSPQNSAAKCSKIASSSPDAADATRVDVTSFDGTSSTSSPSDDPASTSIPASSSAYLNTRRTCSLRRRVSSARATFTHDSALCHARYSGDPTPARDAFFRRFFHVFICLADTDTAAGSHRVAPSPCRT